MHLSEACIPAIQYLHGGKAIAHDVDLQIQLLSGRLASRKHLRPSDPSLLITGVLLVEEDQSF